MDWALAFARDIRSATTFEAGARVLLDEARARVDDALASAGARSLRGFVHLRTAADGYRALAVRDWTGGGDAAPEPSATVWGWLERGHGCVAVDLGTCRGVQLGSDATFETVPAYVAHDPTASIQQMLAREATHLVALPLRSEGVLEGMAAVELSWPERTGKAWPAGAWGEPLALLAELGARVAALPTEPHAREPDPLLPVLGRRTRALLDVLDVFAEHDETILFTGPSGSGKSRLAAWCHARSRRRTAPFETANLLAMPETIQMAELFGWKRGAFTGAQSDHDGLVTTAAGGTLFLDEIDKLSLAAQAGLLRLLETRRYAPLGATTERDADVRFVVATNADLRARVREGAFREDLYYRIAVLPVHLEGLSARQDEIAGWATFMLARRHAETTRGDAGAAPKWSAAAAARLAAAAWPGNLRQLDNVVRRAYALGIAQARSRGEAKVTLVDEETVDRALALEPGDAATPSELGFDRALREVAEAIVERALGLRARGETVTLDELDVLRAAVLRAATDRVGSVKDAYLLFGADAMVRSRNHAKDYKRLLDALEALEKKLLR